MQPVEIEEDYSYEKPGKEVFNPDHTQKQTEEPVGWKEKLLSAVGWETGKEINFAIGIGIDVLLFVIWLILIFTLLPSDQRNSLWYMPILGILFMNEVFDRSVIELTNTIQYFTTNSLRYHWSHYWSRYPSRRRYCIFPCSYTLKCACQ
jgi:hypothetical protein